MAYLPGRRLTFTAADTGLTPDAIHAMAQLLATFHQMPLPADLLPRPTTAEVIQTVREWAARTEDRRLQRAVERLVPLPEDRAVFVHGDLNLGNLLFTEAGGVAG